MKKRKSLQSSTSPTPKLISEKTNSFHTPVLLTESVDALNVFPEGIYVDCTFGGGGHSGAILQKLGKEGRLFAFDQDEEVGQLVPNDPRLTFIPQNFRHLGRFLKLHGISKVDGILADLGVSSHHFDDAQRGFSTRFDAPLDMRMDRRQTRTAAEVVNSYDEKRLHRLFEQYGEIRNAKSLARKIVEQRGSAGWNTTAAFRQALQGLVRGNPSRYFAQVFQAIRIEVNDELGALKEMLTQVPGLLNPAGRVVIITFHSLEDRIVKHFFRLGSFDEQQETFGGLEKGKVFRVITKKPVVPSEVEIKGNPRARSAKLRAAEKI